MYQKRLKNDSRITELFYAEYGLKKTLCLKHDKCLKSGKIGHFAKAIVRQNCHFGAKIQKAKKHATDDSRIRIDLFYAKNGSKKHLILEKLQLFENWQTGYFAKAMAKQNGQFMVKIQNTKKKIRKRL